MAGINETARLLATLELQDKFSGPARAAEGALGRLEGGFGRISAGLGQMGRGVGQIGHGIDQIATRAAIATVGIGTAIITTAATMEQAFVGVQKTVEETADVSFEQLRQKLRELSSETGTAFEELARIGETGGALGVPIADLDEFIDVVNRLGVSTDLSTDAAATALGQLATTLHLSGDEFESFADTLVALGNAGASTEPQIVELAARFAAAGNRAGLSSDEILALSSAVASMGVEVEAGGTALSQTFNKIALAIGTGSDEVQGFTDVLGISAGEFRRRWETDALGTFQDFLQEIGKLDPIAQAVALDMAGITGQRQLNAVGLMADNWGFVGEQIGVAKSAQGELREESDKFFGTTIAGFGKLRENLRLSAETIGTQLLPIVGELTAEMVGFIQDPKTQQAIKEFGTNLAGGIRDFITEVRKFDFGPLIGTLQGAASIAKVAFDAFRSLPQPIQQLALAAIVANKVTGGAVGSIASGLGNIAGGLIKIAFERGGSPVNPLWVQSVGGIGGVPSGPTGPTTGGGFGRLLLGVTGVGLAVMLADEFEEEIEGFAGDLRHAIVGDFPGLPSGPNEWEWPFGSKNTPTILPEVFGDNGLLGGTPGRTPGTASFTGPRAQVNVSGDQSGTSQWARGLDGVKQTVESGTAQWVRGLSGLTSEVASQGGRQLAKQEAIAAAVRVNTSVLASKNYAPKFNLTALVTNNVSISDIQRRITSQSVALGLPTRPEPI